MSQQELFPGMFRGRGTLALFTAVVALVPPITTAIYGGMRLRIEREQNKQEIRLEYLRRATEASSQARELEIVLDFLVVTLDSEDPIRGWAEGRLRRVRSLMELLDDQEAARDSLARLEAALVEFDEGDDSGTDAVPPPSAADRSAVIDSYKDLQIQQQAISDQVRAAGSEAQVSLPTVSGRQALAALGTGSIAGAGAVELYGRTAEEADQIHSIVLSSQRALGRLPNVTELEKEGVRASSTSLRPRAYAIYFGTGCAVRWELSDGVLLPTSRPDFSCR